MGRTRKSLRKKQNKNEVPESTPDQDRVQQNLSPDLEVLPNIINDSISGSHINAEWQNTEFKLTILILGCQTLMLIFLGIESWKVWFSRFTEVADRKGWNKDDRLDELLQRLHCQAGDFAYGQLPRRARQDYDLLIDELNSRYRVIETSKTFRVKLSNRNQHPHESVEEYAAVLKRLYDQAYPASDRQTRREDLLRRFLDGLQDDTARFQAEYNKEPHDIDEAVAHVVNFVETKARL
ncbi:unnamed protein product [Mytilus coruscus]|uniref:Retrotransposon gag domain-containing protein n=1 Tax=Mytilus coruscus TaxID=42192 RepID=A0A6J7ZTE7_MYTCO|nr:unnamed protein product [Mytilus coruscus]